MTEFPPKDAIPFLTLSVSYRVKAPLRLPPFQGSMWRGALGWALKEVCCLSHEKECQNCVLRKDCLHSHFYATKPQSVSPEPGPSPPRPFVFHLDWDNQVQYYHPGEIIGFNLTLFGLKALEGLPSLVEAIRILGNHGIGRDRTRVSLLEIDILDPIGEYVASLYPNGVAFREIDPWYFPNGDHPVGTDTHEIEIYLSTPSILRRNGTHINQGPSFFELMYSLNQRYRGLIKNFVPNGNGKGEWLDEETELLLELSEEAVPLEIQTFWQDCRRYSNREKRKQSLSGLRGRLRFANVLDALIPILHFGTITHIGNSTSMGLGAYAVSVDGNFWQPLFWKNSD